MIQILGKYYPRVIYFPQYNIPLQQVCQILLLLDNTHK